MGYLKKVCVLSVAMLMIGGCGQKKEQAGTGGGAAVSKPVGIKTPDVIKGKWKSVKLSVYDKRTMKESFYDIAIGSSITLPGSDISIEVNNFFPHYVLKGMDQTSESNELKNPAAEVTVRQGTTTIVHGWLYGKFPSMNDKLNNDKIAMGLVGAEANK
jgi:hypothetical protein